MHTNKKGQVNVYFLVSIALFISMSIYLVFLIVGFYPSKAESIRINSLYGKAYTISELVLRDEGYPIDWNENNVQRLGLASTQYELNLTKISRFMTLCSASDPTHRERLLNATGLADESLLLTIKYLNGTTVMQCTTQGEMETNPDYVKKRSAQISRIGTLQNEIVEVIIYVG